MKLTRVMNMRSRKILYIIVTALTLPLLTFALLDVVFPVPYENLHPRPSTIICDRSGILLRAFLAPDDMWRLPVRLDSVSPVLIQSVLTYEDRHFYRHPGINLISVIRAACVNIRERGFVQGASTITMQVARMMEPKDRTLWNKAVETFKAFQLEARFTKDEILEFYLNLAPYGGNIVGVGAASRLYFDKSPDRLSIGEAALLAAIPNSPNKLRPDTHLSNALKARKKVLRILVEQRTISPSQMREAMREKIHGRRFSMPFEIPHLSTELFARHPHLDTIRTTIDLGTQRLAERISGTVAERLRKIGISNCAVVVVENSSGNVLAMVGSGDFDDENSQGQVNGAMAPRSPGSALKPFVYALALDDGLISPRTILPDLPVDFSGYSPENYEGTFNGYVTAEQALIKSLNVPAVNLSAKMKTYGLYEFLKEAGVSTLQRPRDHYGLSLVLGGGEVTLLDLTNTYSGLARGGIFKPYRILKDERVIDGERLLSREACYITTEILSELRRPDLPSVWDWTVDMPKIAWKTGTSYGRRDAWSIGYTPDYTVGVWAGNFDGTGVPELVGAETAAPILFQIFRELESGLDRRWFTQPDGVERRQVCAVSGMALSEYCSQAATELFIPGKSPSKRCDMHRPILVDKETGYRLCSRCRSGRNAESRIVEIWPAEIASWLAQNGHPVDSIPEHNPDCSKILSGEAPVISSPQEAEYKIRQGVDPMYQQILLNAHVPNHVNKIFWFLDKELIFAGSPERKVFITPQPGKHTVVCSDGEGRSSQVRFVVR